MSENPLPAPLHERPRAVLDFIRGFVRRNRVAPSMREIMAGCNLSTTSVVNYYLERLERDGYLRRSVRSGTYRAPRSLVLVDTQPVVTKRPARAGTRRAKVLAALEGIFAAGDDPECDLCGQTAKAEGDRFCAGCRRWLERFAGTTTPSRASQDMARCLAAMLRSGERPAEWSSADTDSTR